MNVQVESNGGLSISRVKRQAYRYGIDQSAVGRWVYGLVIWYYYLIYKYRINIYR